MNARIVLVDDQVLFVESLKSVMVERASDLEVVGIGHNGYEAVELARKCLPDIMLVDVRMPEMSGVAAVRTIHAEYPNVRVVMLTTYDDDEYVTRAIENGAIGYLLKDMPPDDLFSAVRAVKAGAFLLPGDIAQKLVTPKTGSVYHGGVEETSLPGWYYTLSPKERRVLRLLAERYSNKEIGQNLHLAEQTVKNYLSGIYNTLGVSGRAEAIDVASEVIHFL